MSLKHRPPSLTGEQTDALALSSRYPMCDMFSGGFCSLCFRKVSERKRDQHSAGHYFAQEEKVLAVATLVSISGEPKNMPPKFRYTRDILEQVYGPDRLLPWHSWTTFWRLNPRSIARLGLIPFLVAFMPLFWTIGVIVHDWIWP